MKAMVHEAVSLPLNLVEPGTPQAGSGQVLVEVSACAVCRTDLHVLDSDLTDAKLPIL